MECDVTRVLSRVKSRITSWCRTQQTSPAAATWRIKMPLKVYDNSQNRLPVMLPTNIVKTNDKHRNKVTNLITNIGDRINSASPITNIAAVVIKYQCTSRVVIFFNFLPLRI